MLNKALNRKCFFQGEPGIGLRGEKGSPGQKGEKGDRGHLGLPVSTFLILTIKCLICNKHTLHLQSGQCKIKIYHIITFLHCSHYFLC